MCFIMKITMVEFNTKKRIEAEREKYGNKNGQALYKLINIAACSKTMEDLRNRIGVKLVSNNNNNNNSNNNNNNNKNYLKWMLKPSYMLPKI